MSDITTGTEIISHPIETIQPQLSREQPQKVVGGWQKLLENAEKVNRLSEQLEQALFELKVTASEIKCDRHAHPMSDKLFKQKLIVIPCIHYKRPGSVAIVARKIDLFQHEREALQVAQMLRRRTKRRLKRPIPTALSESSVKGQKAGFVRQLVLTWENLKIVMSRKPNTRNRPPRVNTLSCYQFKN